MARTLIAAAVATYLLAILQSTLGGRIPLWGVSPDLLLVWTICLGLLAGPEAGALAGFASGTLQGSLGQLLIGALAISKTVSGLTAGLLASKIYKDNWFAPAVCALCLTVMNEALFALLTGSANAYHAGRVIALRAAYHAILAPPVYALVVHGRRALVAKDRSAR